MDQEVRARMANQTPQEKHLRAIVAVPAIRDFYFTPHRLTSLGARTVSNILSNLKIEHSLLDFPATSKSSKKVSLPPDLKYLEPYIIEDEIGGTSFFSKYQRLGPSAEDCGEAIARLEPNLCLISCFAFCYAMETLELAEAVKKRRPGTIIVVGGGGPSAYPEYFCRHSAIDLVLTGEAEATLPDLIRALQAGQPNFSEIPGCFWKRDGLVVHSMLGQRYSTPQELDMVWTSSRSRRGETVIATELSRGCPKQCRFCSQHLCHGTTFRTVPLEKVRDALRAISFDENAESMRISVNFEDDNLLLDKEYLVRVMDLFRQKLGPCSFLMENGIDYALLTPRLIATLVNKGMSQFNLSLASADSQVMATESRDLNLAGYEKILATLQGLQVSATTYFICGLKGDTTETVASTLAYLASKHTRIGISMFYPVPGLPDFADRTRFDSTSPLLCAGSAAYPWNGAISTGTLVTAFRLSRYINLTKSAGKSIKEQELISRIAAEKKLYTLQRSKNSIEIIPVPTMDTDLIRLFFSSKISILKTGVSNVTIS
jgi:anaerobic magnesium-protoporphyrin IX monomethyl ester cyclase